MPTSFSPRTHADEGFEFVVLLTKLGSGWAQVLEDDLEVIPAAPTRPGATAA